MCFKCGREKVWLDPNKTKDFLILYLSLIIILYFFILNFIFKVS